MVILVACFSSYLVSVKKNTNSIFEGETRQFFIGSSVLKVAIADTQATREKGLSDITHLPQDSGLFFVFSERGQSGIWMKDMLFPIDIIWMNDVLEVVDVHTDVSPDTYPTSFHPRTPAQFALEVNAGFSKKHDVKIKSTGSWKTPQAQ